MGPGGNIRQKREKENLKNREKLTLRYIIKYNFQLKPGICSIIKIEDVNDVLGDAPVKAADAIILFCQVYNNRHHKKQILKLFFKIFA